MIYFLTSSHCVIGEPRLNPANGFLKELKEALNGASQMLLVASNPEDSEGNDRMAAETLEIFEDAGIVLINCAVLDHRSRENAETLVAEADFIYFVGGHVPTQNAFLVDIGMRELMEGFGGVVMGFSAGSMNCADVVYAQPELEGEAVDPDYERFISGLGITQTRILPHYQQLKDTCLDGFHLFWDIACGDSMGRRFFALVDGSFILGYGGHEELRGEAYLIENGAMRKISREDDVIVLSE